MTRESTPDRALQGDEKMYTGAPVETDEGTRRPQQMSAGKDRIPTTGAEPMTGSKASYRQPLSRGAGVDFDPGLSKADASKLIDKLQQRTGRGLYA